MKSLDAYFVVALDAVYGKEVDGINTDGTFNMACVYAYRSVTQSFASK